MDNRSRSSVLVVCRGQE